MFVLPSHTGSENIKYVVQNPRGLSQEPIQPDEEWGAALQAGNQNVIRQAKLQSSRCAF